MRSDQKLQKRYNAQMRISEAQENEIALLKEKIASLESACAEKDKLLDSIDETQIEFQKEINVAKEKQAEAQELIKELREMKAVMNQSFFKGRWKLVQLLLR